MVVSAKRSPEKLIYKFVLGMPNGDDMRVAFGMENENYLKDGHYGDSKFFLIYEIDDGKITLIERRENSAQVNSEKHGDVDKFRAVISQLQDVDAFAAYRMGPNFVRIRDNTDKKVFFTRARDLKTAINRVLEEIKASE